jgi:hypothetical protein
LDKSPTLPQNLSGKYDVVVFDGVPEKPVDARGVLTLGQAGPTSPVRVSGTAKRPRFVSSETSPLMKGVDLHSVFVDTIQKVAPKPEGRVLAETSDGPLVVSAESAGKRQIYLSFSPLQSDFPLQVAFPIFIANALDYLGGSGAANVLAVKAGVPFSVPATQTATVKGPMGSFRVEPLNGAAVIREARTVGEYKIETAGKEKTVYATFQSDLASNIEPVGKLKIGSGAVKSVANPSRFADFWRPLALACLALLCAEWALFARRS